MVPDMALDMAPDMVPDMVPGPVMPMKTGPLLCPPWPPPLGFCPFGLGAEEEECMEGRVDEMMVAEGISVT